MLRIYFPSWKFFDSASPEHFEFEFAFLSSSARESSEKDLKWIRLPSERRKLKHLFLNPFENMRAYVFSRLDVLLREKARLSAEDLLKVDGMAKALVYSYENLRELTEDYGRCNSVGFQYRLLLLDLSEQASSDKGLQTTVLYSSPPIDWDQK